MKRYIRSSEHIADSFPDMIYIETYPETHKGYTYKKDYLHEGGGCYYHSDENDNPVDGCFVSLYPDGHLTYLWDGVEKPFNRDWREVTSSINASTDVLAPERALTFRYSDDCSDKAHELCNLLDSEGITYVMYDDGGYGFKFVVSRSGRKWNDIMKLINSVKSAKYDYKQTIFDERDGKTVEVIDHGTIYSASMTPDEVVDAIYNNKPFDNESYNEYASVFNQPAAGAIKAKDIRVGDIIKNTECAEELDLGDIFVVKKITQNAPGWEDWDYTFTVKVMTLRDRPTIDIHYEADEYVGTDASDESIHEF